jgi:colicin import membrane protein
MSDELKSLGANVFERNFSLTSILYCGKITGFPVTPTCPSDRQSVIDAAKAAADKAAADLKAKQEGEMKAAADKAAAELKAKQEAEAKAATEKAALGKAQSELAAANTALADSQKVNREQAARISSLEMQLKAVSESVTALQTQVSQLNSKLVAALAGQNAVNAKLKKVCSSKPKPKGC